MDRHRIGEKIRALLIEQRIEGAGIGGRFIGEHHDETVEWEEARKRSRVSHGDVIRTGRTV